MRTGAGGYASELPAGNTDGAFIFESLIHSLESRQVAKAA